MFWKRHRSHISGRRSLKSKLIQMQIEWRTKRIERLIRGNQRREQKEFFEQKEAAMRRKQ